MWCNEDWSELYGHISIFIEASLNLIDHLFSVVWCFYCIDDTSRDGDTDKRKAARKRGRTREREQFGALEREYHVCEQASHLSRLHIN